MTAEDPVSAAASQGPPWPRGPRAKAAAVLAAVFLLGGLAGGALGRMTAFREVHRMMEGPHARSRLEGLRRHLDLRDDQVPRVRTILDEAEVERDRLMSKCGPELDELWKRTEGRIREVLDEEQRKRFDELGARRGHHRHGPRGGPPHDPPHGPPP